MIHRYISASSSTSHERGAIMATQPVAEKKWLSNEEAAQELGIAPQTLINWRSQRKGPKSYKSGRNVRYRPADVAAWLENNSVEYE